ncbi:hypothetical protein [Paenibacillus hubeiensis]|uniref:hypothetical protein n=1 Tax=Paenibacillus hubeiensis TaxID=3077330 RepID=UPI0031BBA290
MEYTVLSKKVDTLKDALLLICNISSSAEDSLTFNIRDAWCSNPECECECPYKGSVDTLLEQYPGAVHEMVRTVVSHEYNRRDEDPRYTKQFLRDVCHAYKKMIYITGGSAYHPLEGDPQGVLYGWEQVDEGYLAYIGYWRDGSVLSAARAAGMV